MDNVRLRLANKMLVIPKEKNSIWKTVRIEYMGKKTIVAINSMTRGSTGKIMFEVAEGAKKAGYEYYTASAVHGNETRICNSDHIYISSKLEKKMHLILAKQFGMNGMFSHIGTFLFLRKLDLLNPDLIHLHNLHNCYINLPMLFSYIDKKKIPVVWTLHDCWSFTGHCPYFDMVSCDKWINYCFECPQYKGYPYSRVDNTFKMFQRKKKWFSSENIKLLVTPSNWLASEVKKSFLQQHPIETINNGIDLSIFKPYKSQIREKLNIVDKKIVLGVANAWERRKGYDDFLKLQKMLGDDYQIILIGMDNIPNEDGIIRIKRTENQKQLAEFYSIADVFANPTYEEVFGMVNAEALACGTPVVTYKSGGSPESLCEGVGVIVEKGNISEFAKAIRKVCNEMKPVNACIDRAKKFSKELEIENYVSAYRGILKNEEK